MASRVLVFRGVTERDESAAFSVGNEMKEWKKKIETTFWGSG